MRAAHSDYQNYVKTGQKEYGRFSLDFLRRNQVVYCNPLPSIAQEADLRVQWGQLIDILITREDLIARYFETPDLSSAHLEEMVSHFMRGTGKITKSRYKRITPAWRVHPNIGPEEWLQITESMNALGLFTSQLSVDEAHDLFCGTLDHQVRASENIRVSCFLGHLSQADVISSKWQHLFGTEGKILKFRI